MLFVRLPLISSLVLALAACGAAPRAPETPQPPPFPPSDLSRLDAEDGAAVVINAEGRVLDAQSGTLQLLGSRHWARVRADGTTIYDAVGRAQARYPRLAFDPPLALRSGARWGATVYPVRSGQGSAVLNADGKLVVPFQQEAGWWERTAHADRVLFITPTHETLFDADGNALLRWDLAQQQRVSGPFAGTGELLLCPVGAGACHLHGADGKPRLTFEVDQLAALQGGQYLGRRGSAWFRFDAEGRVSAPELFQEDGALRPRQADTPAPRWPLWVTRFPVDASTLEPRRGEAMPGFLHQDGRFVPVPGGKDAERICPQVWLVTQQQGGQRSRVRMDGHSSTGTPMTDDFWGMVTFSPDWRVARRSNPRQQALLDCAGRTLVDDPQIIRFKEHGEGLAALLKGEYAARVWYSRDLQRSEVPRGYGIEDANARGTVLKLETAGGQAHLFDVASGKLVSTTLPANAELLEGGARYRQGELWGFQSATAAPLAPVYQEMLPWQQRLVTLQVLPGQEQVVLRRASGEPLTEWQGQGLLVQTEGELLRVGLNTLVGRQQQWVTADGAVRATLVSCPGGRVVVGSSGEPVQDGAGCPAP
ncbi:hypothetical protein [Isoalcanivorax beigongshangi]|uniref:WG containing repeat-containing protein n=1 Tax=Isoalcanivorax beigongshangi TaxID=3238810 RepID=A0ABV4AKF1_9GAMM